MIEWVNPAFEELTGYALAEVVGRSPGAFLQCEESDPETVAEIRRALDAGDGVRVQIMNRAKSGRAYWVDMDIQPIRGDDGALEGYIAIESDVTDELAGRRRLEAVIERRWRHRYPGRIPGRPRRPRGSTCTRRAASCWGCSRHQMLGRPPVDPHWRSIRAEGRLRDFPGMGAPASDGALAREG